MAKYNALDLAKKIVNIAGDMGFSITSLQLQKVMYYVQGNYMKAFSEKAFEEDILCWDYGPVVESVWRFFNRYGRYPIKHKFETSVELTEHEKNLIETILKEKLTMLNVIVCFVISVVSSFFMIYIVGLIGINTFVDFVNDNIIQLVIGGIASIIASIVVYYKNFYKKL